MTTLGDRRGSLIRKARMSFYIKELIRDRKNLEEKEAQEGISGAN